MAKKENTTASSNGISNGEIGTIRQILMGQLMNEYDNRFQEMEASINKLEQSIQQIHKLIEGQLKDQIGLLERNTLSKLDQQENSIKEMVGALEKKFDRTQQDDKARLGKMLSDVGKKLMGE